MAKWFGYGEDALTYWALRNHLDRILDQLNDDSDPNNALVFYRPSFGRGGRGEVIAEFGEFDAILATANAIYPIEAKWAKSAEARNSVIEVKDTQIERHKIFRWYLAHYANAGKPSWNRFVDLCDSDFRATFPKKKLAPVGSILAGNIEYILQKLAPFGNVTTDVVLYLHPRNSPPTEDVYPEFFALVNIAFAPEQSSRIFAMDS